MSFTKKAVERDHFKQFKYPGKLEVSEGGALAYTVAEVDVEKNEYPARLFVKRSETAEAVDVMDASHLTDFFWAGETLLINALTDEADKKNADKGLPISVISAYESADKGVTELLKIDKTIETAACLSEDKWLFVCKENPLTEKRMEEANRDPAAFLERTERESETIVAEEYPLRLDADGYVSGVRRRAYLYANGALTRVTPENMNIERLKAYRDEYAVFYGNEQTGFLGDETAALYRLDLKTFDLAPVDGERYVYLDLLALGAEEIIALRSDRRLYGDSQDHYADRISLKDASFERLNGDCAFHLYSNVYTDILYGTAGKALGADGRDALFIEIGRAHV